MPRPNDLDPEFLKDWEKRKKDLIANCPPEMAHLYANPAVRDKLLEINLAGHWLHTELAKKGVEDDKIQRLCFVFGQKCMMAPDVWNLAQKTLDVFMRGYNRAMENAQQQQKAAEEEHKIVYDYGFSDDEKKALWDHYCRFHSF